MTCCNQKTLPVNPCFQINQLVFDQETLSWKDQSICALASLLGLISERFRTHTNLPIGIDFSQFFFCNISNLPYLTSFYLIGRPDNSDTAIQQQISNMYALAILSGESDKLSFPIVCNEQCESKEFFSCFGSTCCEDRLCSIKRLSLTPIAYPNLHKVNRFSVQETMDVLDKYKPCLALLTVTPDLDAFYRFHLTTRMFTPPVFTPDPNNPINYFGDRYNPTTDGNLHVVNITGYECGADFVDFIVRDSFSNNRLNFDNLFFDWKIRVNCTDYDKPLPFTFGTVYGNLHALTIRPFYGELGVIDLSDLYPGSRNKIEMVGGLGPIAKYCCNLDGQPLPPPLPDQQNPPKQDVKDQNKVNVCDNKSNNRKGMFISNGTVRIANGLRCEKKTKPEPKFNPDPTIVNDGGFLCPPGRYMHVCYSTNQNKTVINCLEPCGPDEYLSECDDDGNIYCVPEPTPS